MKIKNASLALALTIALVSEWIFAPKLVARVMARPTLVNNLAIMPYPPNSGPAIDAQIQAGRKAAIASQSHDGIVLGANSNPALVMTASNVVVYFYATFQPWPKLAPVSTNKSVNGITNQLTNCYVFIATSTNPAAPKKTWKRSTMPYPLAGGIVMMPYTNKTGFAAAYAGYGFYYTNGGN